MVPAGGMDGWVRYDPFSPELCQEMTGQTNFQQIVDLRKRRIFVLVPLLHLVLSFIVAGSTAILVFLGWFPHPFRDLAGGTQLFWMIAAVDVVCGPLLTWVLFKPEKSRVALAVDLSLIVLIQVSALAYGLHTLSYARPLAVIYEVDRFRVVSFADLAESDLMLAPTWVAPWGFTQPRVMGVRSSTTLDEKLANLDASLQGVEPSQRPSWWQDYALNRAQVLARSRPLEELRKKHPTYQELIDTALAKALSVAETGETSDSEALRWLPLVSRRTMNWVVLIDPVTARIRGYVPVDGF